MIRWVKLMGLAALTGVLVAGYAGQGGMGAGIDGMQMGPDNTAGWAMMSPRERDEHQRKMMASKTGAECQATIQEHHRLMAERAKAKGMAMDMPRQDMCAQMMQQGMKK